MASISTYNLMKRLITNYNNGKGSKTEEDLRYLLDVYLAGVRITEEQYKELNDMIQ